MNAGDFLDRLTDQQRSAYVDGVLDTMSYAFAAAGDADKASCANDWYYRGPGPRQLAAVLPQHRDAPVAGMLQILFRRACKAAAQ